MEKQGQTHKLHDREIQGQKERAAHKESQNKRYDVFFHAALCAGKEPPEKKDQPDEYGGKEQRPCPRIFFLFLFLVIHILRFFPPCRLTPPMASSTITCNEIFFEETARQWRNIHGHAGQRDRDRPDPLLLYFLTVLPGLSI
ncbi:MAG: hypothetical protein IIB68_06010 [Proteobacteria bacterium]|nr:hypothetical protein [Pseudomonadota bacterium]